MTPVTGIINDPEAIWRFAGELDVTIDAMDLVNSDHGDAIYRGDTLNPQIAGTAVDMAARVGLRSERWPDQALHKIFYRQLDHAVKNGYENEALKNLAQIRSYGSVNDIQAIYNMVSYDHLNELPADDQERLRILALSTEDNQQIMTLANRTVQFFKKYDRPLSIGFNLSDYRTSETPAVDGEIDYLGRDGVWDIKTGSWHTRFYGNAPFITDPSDDDGYKYPVSRRNLLQVILYYLIGLHCHDAGVFENMNYLGIYNARYDMGVKIDIDQLPQTMMHDLEVNTLGVKPDVAKFWIEELP